MGDLPLEQSSPLILKGPKARKDVRTLKNRNLSRTHVTSNRTKYSIGNLKKFQMYSSTIKRKIAHINLNSCAFFERSIRFLTSILRIRLKRWVSIVRLLFSNFSEICLLVRPDNTNSNT